MITVYSTLRDGAGDEIEHGQSSAHSVPAANAAANAWAKGRLAGCDDPDAYVEHVWTQSQEAA